MLQLIGIIGLIGSIFLAFSGLPQAIKSLRDKHSNGVALGTVWLWWLGELAMTIYTLATYSSDYILLLNYTANLVLVSVIFFYKHFPKL